jgi:hypothetical protein
MKSIAKSLLGSAAATLLATAAFAADAPPLMIPAVQPVVVAPAPAPGFSFAGAYAGVLGGAYFEGGAYINADLQVQAGFNLVRGALLVGVEGRVLAMIFPGAVTVELGADLRAGLVLGDRVLVYGRGGVAIFSPDGEFNYTLGGGVEVGVGQRLSVFGEAVAYSALGAGLQGVDLRAGINLHFGN